MRPMGVMLQRIIRGYREDCVIYRLPKGTGLPETMVLLHKHTDHFSIQTTKPVELAGKCGGCVAAWGGRMQLLTGCSVEQADHRTAVGEGGKDDTG